ncbi:MAG: hypothetical protein HY744_01375 [Deltaproteobacteria bacterium]|nr:hypothetical protein [Deltaproteobacteria bacterium]
MGKCPQGLPDDLPERLLNEGIGVDGDELTPGPKPLRIYIVHDGVVYRAKPTNPEVGSWHAFPEFPEELRKLPDAIWDRIRERAEHLGCAAEVERWKKG